MRSQAASRQAPLVVAIDGPAGAGKGTVAREIARRLGVPYLDTGAMYRALGLKMLELGLDPSDGEAAAQVAEDTEITLEPREGGKVAVLLDGQDVEGKIRTEEVSRASSQVAVHPRVRLRMVEIQQACGRRQGGVIEGRDIGTRVFPDTPHKFYLDASPEERARRRYEQLRGSGKAADLAEVEADMKRRDRQDQGRGESPLTWDETYHHLDTTGLSVAEVVERVLAEVGGGL
jgi:cytidylate kinase